MQLSFVLQCAGLAYVPEMFAQWVNECLFAFEEYKEAPLSFTLFTSRKVIYQKPLNDLRNGRAWEAHQAEVQAVFRLISLLTIRHLGLVQG